MANEEIKNFLESWQNDKSNIKPAFVEYMDMLIGNPDIETSFKSRPGISYSLRAKNHMQKKRDLFVLVDIVDDDPDNRWLSICFYADLVTDPQEKGDLVPAGLFGDDAICFNLEDDDKDMRAYIRNRLQEAARLAKD